MKQNQIEDLPKLDFESYENIFNVYQTKTGMYYYNIIQTINFPQNLPAALFDTYVISYGDTWPFISYKTIGTPNMWWIILLANNIINPIAPLVNGTIIKIPKLPVVREVMAQIISE